MDDLAAMPDPAPNPAPAPVPGANGRAGARLSVLVAEDDELLRAYLALQVERMGHEAAEADSGETALAALESGRFDVLISDWVMPRMSGIDLIRKVRARDRGYLHVILMTAPGEERTIRDALAAGADDFLLKPLTALDIELGLGAALRVVKLKRSLERRNAALEEARARLEGALSTLRDDLASAARLQRRLLPKARIDGPLRHATSFTPSLAVGGDSIGLVPLAGGQHFYFALDVSGHGVPAALNSFSLHRRISGLAEATGGDLAGIAARLNRQMLDEDGENYLTAIFARIGPDGSGDLLRAGHPLPLLHDRSGVRALAEGCVPIGLLPDADFAPTRLTLEPGARLLIYSDGVTDGGLSPETLAATLAGDGDRDLAAALATIDALLLRARGGGAPQDDISMLAIERGPPASGPARPTTEE